MIHKNWKNGLFSVFISAIISIKKVIVKNDKKPVSKLVKT